MFKHANTYFPGDKVAQATDKTASAQQKGRVVDADAESGQVKVEWEDGHTSFVEADKLAKL
jgi:hypothetical protein